MRISVVLITLNEAHNLPRALESLRGVADELVVVDSGSTDDTVAITTQFAARVVSHVWEGYAQQKNFAASLATHDWVLSLDADEALSPELAEEIKRLKQSGPGEAAGFTMPRLARYQGRWIRHCGWYPDRKLRLYDRTRGRWVGDYVHEGVQVRGPVGSLSNNLLHYTCDTFEQHFRTLERYTELAAREACERREGFVVPRMILLPPWKFVETYLLRQGFRDGRQGLFISAMAAYYVFRKYAKLRKLTRPSPG